VRVVWLLVALLAAVPPARPQDALALTTPGAVRQEMRQVSGGPLVIHYTPERERLARRLLEAGLAALSFPGLPDDLLAQGPPVNIYLAIDPSHWDLLTGGRAPVWGAGVAIRDPERVVLPAYASPRGSTLELERTLRHELAHIALGRWLPGALIPRWFDEGYARWAAGEWDPQAAWELRVAFMTQRAPPLDSITLDWPAAAAEARIAYSLSTTAIIYLIDRSGERGLELFLARWRETGSMEQALRRTYGVTSTQLEEHWRAWVRRRYGWLFFLSHSVVFWIAIVLLTLVLFMPRRRRDRARLDALRANEIPDQPEWWAEGEAPAADDPNGPDPGPGGEERGSGERGGWRVEWRRLK
jgi:hypothetical protein